MQSKKLERVTELEQLQQLYEHVMKRVEPGTWESLYGEESRKRLAEKKARKGGKKAAVRDTLPYDYKLPGEWLITTVLFHPVPCPTAEVPCSHRPSRAGKIPDNTQAKLAFKWMESQKTRGLKPSDFGPHGDALAYQQFQRLLREARAVDFDDMLMLVRDLLRQERAVRMRLQASHPYLLVDEYQDSNPLQARFPACPFSAGGNVQEAGWQARGCGCADRHRGRAAERDAAGDGGGRRLPGHFRLPRLTARRLSALHRHLPARQPPAAAAGQLQARCSCCCRQRRDARCAAEVAVETFEWRRSRPAILDVGIAALQDSLKLLHKELRPTKAATVHKVTIWEAGEPDDRTVPRPATRGGGAKLALARAGHILQEAEQIADKARQLHETEGVPYEEMAVLLRVFRGCGLPAKLLFGR